MDASFWKRFEGQWIDRVYYLERLLGFGAFGGVFLANHVSGKEILRTVAVKLMLEVRMEELKQGLNLSHPNLIRCFDAREVRLLDSAFQYLIMELADGTLDDQLKSGPISAEAALDLGRSLASVLAHLASGERRIAHRDLKPANVMRVGDCWKLSDGGSNFGFRCAGEFR